MKTISYIKDEPVR